MKITVPAKWKEVADRFEAQGIELSVIGRSSRGEETAAAFIENAKHLLVQLKIEVPAELTGLKFRPDALVELQVAVASLLREAVARASKAHRSEVTAEDVKPVGSP
jgi:hypothetical protein